MNKAEKKRIRWIYSQKYWYEKQIAETACDLNQLFREHGKMLMTSKSEWREVIEKFLIYMASLKLLYRFHLNEYNFPLGKSELFYINMREGF